MKTPFRLRQRFRVSLIDHHGKKITQSEVVGKPAAAAAAGVTLSSLTWAVSMGGGVFSRKVIRDDGSWAQIQVLRLDKQGF